MTIKPFEVHRPKREYNESKLLNKIGNINPSLPQDIVEIVEKDTRRVNEYKKRINEESKIKLKKEVETKIMIKEKTHNDMVTRWKEKLKNNPLSQDLTLLDKNRMNRLDQSERRKKIREYRKKILKSMTGKCDDRYYKNFLHKINDEKLLKVKPQKSFQEFLNEEQYLMSINSRKNLETENILNIENVAIEKLLKEEIEYVEENFEYIRDKYNYYQILYNNNEDDNNMEDEVRSSDEEELDESNERNEELKEKMKHKMKKSLPFISPPQTNNNSIVISTNSNLKNSSSFLPSLPQSSNTQVQNPLVLPSRNKLFSSPFSRLNSKEKEKIVEFPSYIPSSSETVCTDFSNDNEELTYRPIKDQINELNIEFEQNFNF